jgi:type IV secretory pathway TrbL component
MIIEIENSIIIDGTAGSIFDNDRGIFRATNISVTNVKAASLIATANTGTSFLDQSSITCKLYLNYRSIFVRFSYSFSFFLVLLQRLLTLNFF